MFPPLNTEHTLCRKTEAQRGQGTGPKLQEFAPGRAESQPWLWTPEPYWSFWNRLVSFQGVSEELCYHTYSFTSQCKEEFGKSKTIDEWFIRITYLWGLQAGGWEMTCPGNLQGYSFIIKGIVGRGRGPSLSLSNRRHAFISSSSSRLGRGVFLSLRGRARPTHCCFFCAAACPRDHWLPELTGQDLLWSWGILCFCCMVLMLSKPAFSRKH